MNTKPKYDDLSVSKLVTSKLLFVDDDPLILRSLTRLFRRSGYHIFTATGGKAGLEILRMEQMDLVISDMTMPDMDGLEFLGLVRVGFPNIIRLLLTASTDINLTVEAVNRGDISHYISKPWDDNDILSVVHDALERHSPEKNRLSGRINLENV
ncbi:MAG: response regulator [Deltaproteobacteria bacterium]|nr:response regulator [Deltaproteobacteria bacterium]